MIKFYTLPLFLNCYRRFFHPLYLCTNLPMYLCTYVPLRLRLPGMTLWERICHSPIAPASKFEPIPAVPNIFRLLFALWAQWCFTSVNEIELLYSTCNNPQQLDNDLFCQFLSLSTLRNSTLDLAINAHQCSTSLSCSIGQLIRPQRYAKCWETKTSSTLQQSTLRLLGWPNSWYLFIMNSYV